jgi:Mg-chelatase subunit ChlD
MNQNFYCPITQEVMKDPVIGPDGVTYERTAIEAWFAAGNATSPLTRQPMTGRQLVSNLALRGAIEEALAAGWSPAAAAQLAAGGAAVPEPTPTLPPTLELGRLHDRRLYVRTMATGETTLPTLFIDVLDISGSMGNSSVDATQAASEAAAFSRSDLVRHSVATQIELLRPCDELSLVLFDNNATVALEPTPMSVHGKLAAKACLPLIHPNGGTNIWLGLQRALQVADRAYQANKERNVVIILQTDGESDPAYAPPRGIIGAFQAWRDAHPAARLTVHTVGYGFGHALDMPLLRQIAEVGDGTVSYIPDGSMVGTVFIHLMSNLMSAAFRDVRLKIPELGICEVIGFLQPGQRREFVFPAPAEGEVFTVTLEAGVHTVEQVAVTLDELPYTELDGPIAAIRQDFLRTLRGSLAKAEGGDVASASADLAAFVARLDALHDPVCDDRRIWALRTDIQDADKYKGQIAKAFESPAAFERWGRHYVPSILCEYERQWPTNFKDETAKILGGQVTRDLINAGDTIFNELPPPTPSATHAYRGSAAGLLAATTSLAATNSAAGPCFLPASRVLMADGTQRRCDEIRPGDIAAPNYVIRCVVKTEVPYADVVFLTRGHTYEDDHTRQYSKDVVPVLSAYGSPEATAAEAESRGGFTLWHPVLVNGSWEHPASVGPVRRVTTDAIYNFVLEWAPPDCASGWALRPEVLVINGVTTCTLGHEMTAPVISHPYFGKRETGKRNVIDDLQEQPGWETGYITWRNLKIEHDAQGLIAGMRPAV